MKKKLYLFTLLFLLAYSHLHAMIPLADACVGEEYEDEVVFTLQESYTIQGFTVDVEGAEIISAAGLPDGLSWSCDPCSALPNEDIVVSIFGTPTSNNSLGEYELSFTGLVQVQGSTYQVNFPYDEIDETVYTIELNDCGNCFLPLDFSKQSASCVDTCDGQLTVLPSNGVEPYTYNWDNGATTSTIADVCSGIYFVTVTDATGCSASTSVSLGVIQEECTQNCNLSLQFSTTLATCSDSCNGQVTAMLTGGTLPFDFEWGTTAGNQTTQTASNLCTGLHQLTVTDAEGCSVSNTVLVLAQNSTCEEPCALTIIPETTTAICPDSCTGRIDLTVNDGIAPFSYQWNNDLPSQASQQNLCAGTYSVTVTDAKGCETSTTIVIENENSTCQVQRECSLSLTTDTFYETCVDSCSGQAMVFATSGTAPYTYLWNAEAGGQTTAMATNLCPGIYEVTVTDAEGCTDSTTVVIVDQQREPLAIQITNLQSTSCFGSTDGSAMVQAMGGTPPYQYNWSTGDTTNTTTGLATGSHSVTVTDAEGCTTLSTMTIEQPTEIQINAITPIGNNNPCRRPDSIQVLVNGGVRPYTYLWSNGSTTTGSGALDIGNASVTVIDANGCIFVQDFNNVGSPSDLDSLCEFITFNHIGTYGAPRYEFSVPNTLPEGRWTAQGDIYSENPIGLGRTHTVEFTFPSDTIFKVCYNYTTEDGCEVECCKTIKAQFEVGNCAAVTTRYVQTEGVFAAQLPGHTDVSWYYNDDILQTEILRIPESDRCLQLPVRTAALDTLQGYYQLCDGYLDLCKPVAGDCEVGINLVENGDFEEDETNFETELRPGCYCGSGTFCIANNTHEKCPNIAWQSIDREGDFLIVHGIIDRPAKIWEQEVNVQEGQTYTLSFDFYANITATARPILLLLANDRPLFSTSGTLNAWETVQIEWIADESGTVPISIVHTNNTPDEFGIDNIKLEFCANQNNNLAGKPTASTAFAEKQITLENYPNPWRNATTFRLQLPAAMEARLEVLNRNGQIVFRTQQQFTKGMNEVVLQKELPAGVYHYRLLSTDLAISRTMLVID